MAPFMDYTAKQPIAGMPNYAQGYNNWLQPAATSTANSSVQIPMLPGASYSTAVDTTTPSGDFFSWDRFLGNDKQMGWGQAGLGIASALGQGFLGWNQYNLEKDKLALSKDAFNKNYGAQVKEYNMNVADRGNARASATGDFAGAKEYYAANKLS